MVHTNCYCWIWWRHTYQQCRSDVQRHITIGNRHFPVRDSHHQQVAPHQVCWGTVFGCVCNLPCVCLSVWTQCVHWSKSASLSQGRIMRILDLQVKVKGKVKVTPDHWFRDRLQYPLPHPLGISRLLCWWVIVQTFWLFPNNYITTDYWIDHYKCDLTPTVTLTQHVGTPRNNSSWRIQNLPKGMGVGEDKLKFQNCIEFLIRKWGRTPALSPSNNDN